MKLGFDKASTSAAVIAGELRQFADALEASAAKLSSETRLIYTAFVEVELWQPLEKQRRKRLEEKK